MNFDFSVLSNEEKIIFGLRSLYEAYGYARFKMGKFEEYDMYVRNKDFLVSDNIITFTDTNGRLMALKPDVTLSIIKSSTDEPDKVQKLYYNENVYRAAGGERFSEIMQTGLECIGNLDSDNINEVLLLAAKSISTISGDGILEISHLGILSGIIDSLGISKDYADGIVRCFAEKNADTLLKICEKCSVPTSASEVLAKLLAIYGEPNEVIAELKNLLGPWPRALEAVCELENEISALSDQAEFSSLRIDLSVSSDMKYYNGLVFNGFIKGISRKILSGGQYDKLMKQIGRSSKAIGFAVYLDALERLDDIEAAAADAEEKPFLTVALPKGRLGEKVYEIFARAGFDCPAILDNTRKLIFENPEKGVRYFWAKPSDVAIYVERGVADIGVAGKDILLEYTPDIYELADLGFGKCRMCVAAPRGFKDDTSKTLRVATKFATIAQDFYSSKGRDIDIIHLNGSIEIAPIIGLSDVIVDLVETGSTLRENNLEVVEEIVGISARLIANKASYKFNSELIRTIQEEIGNIR